MLAIRKRHLPCVPDGRGGKPPLDSSTVPDLYGQTVKISLRIQIRNRFSVYPSIGYTDGNDHSAHRQNGRKTKSLTSSITVSDEVSDERTQTKTGLRFSSIKNKTPG